MAAVAAMNEAGLWLPGVATSKEDKIEKWWEINRKHDPPLTRGATPLIERCMRVYGWGESFTRRTLKGYRQFMELKSVMNDWQETKLAAPLAIHQMWEQHILDNLNYTDDCFLLFGRVVGHDPDAIMNERALADRIKTTRIAFQARYGNDLDPEVWDYGHTGDNEGMAIDAEDHFQTGGNIGHPATPRGRLPVAGIGLPPGSLGGMEGRMSMGSVDRGVDRVVDRVVDRGSMDRSMPMPSMERGMLDRVSDAVSPRNRSSLVVSSNEEVSPGQDQARTGRSRSPVRRTTLAKSPRSPKSPSGNDPITIFLRDSNSGEETYFSLRYRSTLRIVFTVFAERKGLNQETLKFSFNGQTLTGYETPYSLGLEDRARIDVQIGQRRP